MKTVFRCGFRSGKYRQFGKGFSIGWQTGMRDAAMYAWPLGKCCVEDDGLSIPMSFLWISFVLKIAWKDIRSVEPYYEFPFSCVLIRFEPQHPSGNADCVSIRFLRRSARDRFLSVVQERTVNRRSLRTEVQP